MLETKKRTLVACPVCESQGVKSILGEIGTAGDFIVQRFHNGYTIINSPLFSVKCGRCNERVYTKNEGTAAGNWFHFESVAFSVIRGTPTAQGLV